jgi:hypothetical protein
MAGYITGITTNGEFLFKIHHIPLKKVESLPVSKVTYHELSAKDQEADIVTGFV